MQPNIKQGLLVAQNSDINDDELNRLIRHDQPITDYYHLDKDYFARGKFACVRRIQHKQTGIRYAAKTMKKRRLRVGDVTDEIKHEIRVLITTSQCPFIVNLHEIFETNNDFTLVLELAEGGELQQVLDEEESGIEERQCRRLMRQIVEGVRFLHQKHIAHLDIKPQNILLANALSSNDAQDDECFQIKLCDFGISRLIEDRCEVKEIMGTIDYMPPEIVQYEPISLAADMWSIGVVAYVLLSGHSPFGGDNKVQTYSNITSLTLEFPDELFSSISNEAKDFIKKLLIRDPKKRMNCDQCLQHEWLRDDQFATSLKSQLNESNTLNDSDLKQKGQNDKNDENLIILLSSSDSDSDSDAKSTKSSRSMDSTTTNTSSSMTFSSMASLEDEVGTIGTVEDRDSGLGGNICDNNVNVETNNVNKKSEQEQKPIEIVDLNQKPTKSTELPVNGENSTLISEKMEMDENQDENKENIIIHHHQEPKQTSQQPSNELICPIKHHKRLSSDIFPDSKLIAIVSNTLQKKYTSESSMSTLDGDTINTTNHDNNRVPLFTLSTQQPQTTTLLANDNDKMKKKNDILPNITKSGDNNNNSPPSTPSKKFYLSVDDDSYYSYHHFRDGTTTTTANFSPRRIRSVSMERLSTDYTSNIQHAHQQIFTSDHHHHQFPNRTCSFSHKSTGNGGSVPATIPLATIETRTTTTTTIDNNKYCSKQRILASSMTTTTTSIIKGSSNTSSTITTTTTMTTVGGADSGHSSFRIQIKPSLYRR